MDEDGARRTGKGCVERSSDVGERESARRGDSGLSPRLRRCEGYGRTLVTGERAMPPRFEVTVT